MNWLEKHFCPIVHAIADLVEAHPAETAAVLRTVGAFVAKAIPASQQVVELAEELAARTIVAEPAVPISP